MNKLIHVFFYAFILLLLSACGNDSDTSINEVPLRSVKYHTVTAIMKDSTHTYAGLAKSGQESNLSFRVSGTLESLFIKVGDQLKAGQVIAELDSSQYQLEEQKAAASLSQAEATLRNAQANFERLKGLYENNNASRNDLDSARATAESSEAQVKASRKALELARLNVSYTKLKASESCGVADIQAEVNENLTAGETFVLVTCGDKLEVEVAIPESMIAQINREMDATVIFSAIPDKIFDAKVTEVSIASAAGSTYSVIVTLNEYSDAFRSGLAAQVTFQLERNNSNRQYVVPAAAVGEDMTGRYVYLVQDTSDKGVGEIKKQSVTIGELMAEGLGIVEGVKEGDKIVVAGVSVIRDGLKVRID